MSLSKFIWWAGIIAFSAILLDEGAYYVWRRRNRGEHWSHLTEKTPLVTWETVNATR